MSVIEFHARSQSRCSDCGRSFSVPDPQRSYPCPSCGGQVSAPSEIPVGTVVCDGCQAIFPGGTEYCAECGTSLELTRAAPGSDAAARLRREALQALDRASRTIGMVTIGYRLGAAAYAVATCFAVMALARVDVPPGPGRLVVALTTVLSVLLLAGALHLQFHPFLWTCVVAALATAVAAVHWVGPDPLGVAFYASAAWALVAWVGLVPSFRIGRMIAHHRDLYVLHHASARTRRSLKGRTAQERHERLMKAMRRAARRAWRLSAAAAGGVILVSSLSSYLVLAGARPQEFEPSLEAFRAAWSSADPAAVGALFDPRVREVRAARLHGLLAARGWTAPLPALGAGRDQRSDGEVSIEFLLDDTPLTVTWVREGTGWTLVSADLPLPPIEPTLERFAEAWGASDLDVVVTYFAPDVQAEMGARLEAAMEGRSWTALPALDAIEVLNSDGGRASVRFPVDGEHLSTEWHYRAEGLWRLHRLRLPER